MAGVPGPLRACRLPVPGGCHRLGPEVPGRHPQPAEQGEQLPEFERVIAGNPEPGGHQVRGGARHHLAPARGDLRERSPAVAGVGTPPDQAVPLQPVDGVGDAGGVHHEPLADHPERQRAGAAERQQHQGLVPGKGEAVLTEQAIQPGQEYLLRPHDRGDRGHRVGRAEPFRPDLGGALNRIEREVQRLRHRHTLPLRLAPARLPDMDWSLLGCGASGHVTFAPDEPALRDRLNIATREGPAWRCLRCGTFVIGEAQATGPAAEAPQVRRADQVRSALILRIFAVERFLRALIFAALAIAVWRFSVSRLSFEQAYNQALPPLKALLRDFGFSVQHSKLLGLIHEAFTVDSAKLGYLAIGLGAYAVIEVIEGVGLWMVKRWGEYFAMIVTSLGLPYEIYDLTNKVTVLRVVAFVINLALVLYLVLTKRLFGVRGGKRAYEAHLRSESILDAEMAALDAEQGVAAGREPTAQATAAGNSAPAAGPLAAGPPWPDAGTPAAGPPWSDAETPATGGPAW